MSWRAAEVNDSTPSLLFHIRAVLVQDQVNRPLINLDGNQRKAADDLSWEIFLFLLLLERTARS